MKDHETVSITQYHEVLYVAQKFSIPVWMVYKAIDDLQSNIRSEVYEYIRKQIESPVDVYSIVESLSKQTGLRGVRKSIILRAIEDLDTTDEEKIKQHLANEMWSYVDSSNDLYQSAELNDEQKEKLLKAFQEQPLQFSNSPMRNKLNVIQWAEAKNLVKYENRFVQFAKVVEEIGELGKGLIKGDKELEKDSIGDSLVTLIILSAQLGLDIEDCLEHAYQEIKDRTGTTNENGTFIKD